jgi:hypothetical protein
MKSPEKKIGKLIPWGGFLACYLMTLITGMILLKQEGKPDSFIGVSVQAVLLAILAASFLCFVSRAGIDRFGLLFASILILPFSHDYAEHLIFEPVLCIQGILLFLVLAVLSMKTAFFSNGRKRFLMMVLLLAGWLLFALLTEPYVGLSLSCETAGFYDAALTLASGAVRIFGYIPTVTLLTGSEGLLAVTSLIIVFIVIGMMILLISYYEILTGFERELLLLTGFCHLFNFVLLLFRGSLSGSCYLWPTMGTLLLTGLTCDRVFGVKWKQTGRLLCSMLFLLVLFQSYKLYLAQIRVVISEFI